MSKSAEPRTNEDDPRPRWADADQRGEMLDQLQERGIGFQTVAAQAGKPKADPFDLLCTWLSTRLS